MDFALGAPTSAPPALATTFVGPPHDPPSELTTHLRPTGMPGTGDYVVHWRITDKVACKVLYTSPISGESSLDKTLPATGLGVVTDECTGRNRAFVRVDAVVRRGGQTRRESQTASALWLGAPPSDPPEGCDPNPHPDPNPDPTIPPFCRTKPWLCDTVP